MADSTVTPAATPAAAPAATNAENSSGFSNGVSQEVLDGLLKRIIEKPAEVAENKAAPAAPVAEEPPKEGEAAAPEQAADPAANEDNDLSQSAESPEEKPAEQAENGEGEGEAEQGPEWYQKRLAKITRARREAEEKLAEAEARLRDYEGKAKDKADEPPVPVESKDDPFANVWSERDLNAEYLKARDLKRWCEQNASGAVVNGKEYSAEDIREIRYKVEDAIDVHIPQRAAFLAQHKQVTPVAETVYPWWKDRNSEQYQAAQEVLRNAPHLMRHPDYRILVGDFLEGRRMRMERAAAAKAAKPAPKPAAPAKPVPKQPSKPAAAPVKVDAAAKKAAEHKVRLAQTGSLDDLVNLLS